MITLGYLNTMTLSTATSNAMFYIEIIKIEKPVKDVPINPNSSYVKISKIRPLLLNGNQW